MPAEEDMAVVKTFVEEVINSGNLEKVDELVAPDHVNNDPTAPDHAPGAEGIKELIGTYRAGFPDLRFETGQMFAVDGKVAHHWILRGTHEGEFMGIEPTGNKVEAMGVEINHVENGKIKESWTVSDAMTVMQQLGAL
jgi:steroid delta-isomerase-like uncharacterized protein